MAADLARRRTLEEKPCRRHGDQARFRYAQSRVHHRTRRRLFHPPGQRSRLLARIRIEDGVRDIVMRTIDPAVEVGAVEISPDGKFLLYERTGQNDSEIMMVTNFR